MSANIVPSNLGGAAAPRHGGVPGLQSWGSAPQETQFNPGEQIARVAAAIKRYRWLIVAIVAVGGSLGFALSRFVKPKYSVNASIWISKDQGRNSGPIEAPGLITSDLAWPELAKSYLVLDNVVSRLALYVEPADAADTLVFRSLQPSDSLQPGAYRLVVAAGGRGYELHRRTDETNQISRLIERGAVGDSIGRQVGFLWAPDSALFRRGKQYDFDVVTPREASLELSRSLQVMLAPQSNIMRIDLSGERPGLMATTVNTLLHLFVNEAARLKKENLSAASQTVDEQLKTAKDDLERAELAYESFKINTITLPTENTAIAPGTAMSTSPVFTAFFTEKTQFDNIRRDREAIEAILEEGQTRGDRLSVEALRSVPSVLQNNVTLNTAITDLLTLQAQLRVLQGSFTDEHRLVKEVKQKIDVLELETIPAQAKVSFNLIKAQETEMKRRIDGTSEELRKIPTRTIEEGRRQRDVSIATSIVGDLQTRAVNAKLFELTTSPDVAILDSAVAPRRPSNDTALSMFLVSFVASIALGLGLALLLDRIDRRFRYPEQASGDLGLDIVGAVPTFQKNLKNQTAKLNNATQLVESFRSLALTLRSAFDGVGPVQLTISSPGPGDGKSFVSANLATALADGGYRTVLIDGDIRRGTLHETFGPTEQSPGLLDHLSGDAALTEVVRPTSHANLFLIPCGTRRQHGPELLAAEGMHALVRDLRNQFDAIIVDTAPLGAGIDAFAIGAATGAMALVMRAGETDRRLAEAKLRILDRMPVRLIGAILNDMGHGVQFKYYYYLEGYTTSGEPDATKGMISSGDRG